MFKKILDAVTADNGVPSGKPDGSSAAGGNGFWLKPGKGGNAIYPVENEAVVLVHSTAGSGVMTAEVRMYGYVESANKWYPLGVAAGDADRGVLNDGTAIGEIESDSLEFAEIIYGLKHFDGIYARAITLGGTATAIEVRLLSKGKGGV